MTDDDIPGSIFQLRIRAGSCKGREIWSLEVLRVPPLEEQEEFILSASRDFNEIHIWEPNGGSLNFNTCRLISRKAKKVIAERFFALRDDYYKTRDAEQHDN